MQWKIKAGVILVLSLSSYAVIAATPTAASYVGIDYLATNMEGRDRNGYAMRLVLPENYDSYQIYAAHRFDNDVGLSIAWQQSGVERQNHTFSAGETFLGDLQSAGDRTSVSSRIQAINFDVLGYINFIESVEAVGILGLALMRADMNGSTYAAGVTRNLSPSRNFDNIIPRIGAILQYISPFKIGLRVFGVWEGTNLYHMSFTDEDGLRSNIKPFKQSWTVGVGLLGKF